MLVIIVLQDSWIGRPRAISVAMFRIGTIAGLLLHTQRAHLATRYDDGTYKWRPSVNCPYEQVRNMFQIGTITELMSGTHSLSPRIRQLSLLICLLGFGLIPSAAHSQTTLGTQTVQLITQPDGLLYGFPNSLTLSHAGNLFNNYTGSVTIQYRVRTTTLVGTGSITVKASTDFVCASGGPCIATPPTAGDALTYTCTGATLGSNCAGTQTVSTTVARNVVTAIPAGSCTGGGSPCTTASPNTVNLNFTLTDDPKYKTGSYSTTLTFTISAT
jgi:hypothetical protein